jgi:hypothetical protein
MKNALYGILMSVGSPQILFERQARLILKLPIWRASLFAFGSFVYFCCQKYENEAWNWDGFLPGS